VLVNMCAKFVWGGTGCVGLGECVYGERRMDWGCVCVGWVGLWGEVGIGCGGVRGVCVCGLPGCVEGYLEWMCGVRGMADV
jgi:hypothetical protein